LGGPAVRYRLLFVTASILASSAAWNDSEAACICEDPAPLEQQVRTALGNADYVALIEVKSTEFKDRSYDENVAIWNPRTQQSDNQVRHVNERVQVATFEATRVYKGPKSPTRVETPVQGDSCAVNFERGSMYLVYAYQPEPDVVSTSQCMRTALQTEAVRDIEVLDAALRPKSVVVQPSGPAKRFQTAMDLIHSHVGGGDERWQDPKLSENLMKAMQVADELAKSDPLSGYSQAIGGELISIWRLRDDGRPIEAQQDALMLTENALRIAPRLAQAHVAKARIYAKAGRHQEATEAIQHAFEIDPQLDSAMFVQADIYRLSGNRAKAEEWIQYFIEATPQPVQKANGHEWLGRIYRDTAYKPEPYNRDVDLMLAKSHFRTSINLDPKDPWRLVNFAAFLNEYAADFAGAEKYAAQALAIEDIEPAHYELAAARYQSLQSKAEGMDVQSLRGAIVEIEHSTGLSLDELVKSGDFREVVRLRLVRLQRKAPAASNLPEGD